MQDCKSDAVLTVSTQVPKRSEPHRSVRHGGRDASFPEGSGLVLLEPETDSESDGRTHAAWEHALLRHWRGVATLGLLQHGG